MRKYEVLKSVVILQAVCMVVLSVVVIVKIWPEHDNYAEMPPESNQGGEGADNFGLITGGQRPAATVGGQTITQAEWQAALYKLHGENVLRALMTHKAAELEAKATGLAVRPEEESRELQKLISGYDSEQQFYQMMEEQLGMTKQQVVDDVRYRLLLEKLAVNSVVVTDAEVEEYVAQHQEAFGPRSRVHLQWIVTENESEANSILNLLADGEEFALLARTYSTDSFTAGAGGDLGLIDDNDPFYAEELLDTAKGLQIGEMAGPIRTDEGYAIIRLVEREMTNGLTGSALRDEVRKQLGLERAESLTSLEDQLLIKYEAAVHTDK
jgi:foldase protein PrsA